MRQWRNWSYLCLGVAILIEWITYSHLWHFIFWDIHLLRLPLIISIWETLTRGVKILCVVFHEFRRYCQNTFRKDDWICFYLKWWQNCFLLSFQRRQKKTNKLKQTSKETNMNRLILRYWTCCRFYFIVILNLNKHWLVYGNFCKIGFYSHH